MIVLYPRRMVFNSGQNKDPAANEISLEFSVIVDAMFVENDLINVSAVVHYVVNGTDEVTASQHYMNAYSNTSNIDYSSQVQYQSCIPTYTYI